jgi:hypothetical protein
MRLASWPSAVAMLSIELAWQQGKGHSRNPVGPHQTLVLSPFVIPNFCNCMVCILLKMQWVQHLPLLPAHPSCHLLLYAEQYEAKQVHVQYPHCLVEQNHNLPGLHAFSCSCCCFCCPRLLCSLRIPVITAGLQMDENVSSALAIAHPTYRVKDVVRFQAVMPLILI